MLFYVGERHTVDVLGYWVGFNFAFDDVRQRDHLRLRPCQVKRLRHGYTFYVLNNLAVIHARIVQIRSLAILALPQRRLRNSGDFPSRSLLRLSHDLGHGRQSFLNAADHFSV